MLPFEPLEAIKYVSSGITLVAFIVATVAWVYRSRLENRRATIALAKPGDRAALVERTLEFFTVDTEGLTGEQKYQLALKQIEARAERFRLVIKSGLVATGFAAVLSVLLFGMNARGTTPDTGRQLTLVKLEGDGARFPVLKYHDFVAKVIDQNGNPAAGVKVAWTTPIGGDKAYVDVTKDDGTCSAKNIYTFPTTGKYEQVATIAGPETNIGFTPTPAVRVVGPSVTFVYSQEIEPAVSCSDGTYMEGNGLQWTLKRETDALHFVRSDGGCSADFTFSADRWNGRLKCNNGATYAVEVFPNEDCSELRSSLSWFNLHK